MHFYSEKGEPRHFVEMQSRRGELRPTRLADAKKNGWFPSVTTIQGLLDKPALTNWKIDEHLKQAYQWQFQEKDRYINQEDFIRDMKALTQDELDKAPKDGTDFHDVLEKWFKGYRGIGISTFDAKTCIDVESSITKECGKPSLSWITEQSFVHPMGFAGKCDLHADGWVIDYKTKNTADKWKPGKMHYPEMAMQLAAYRVGLGLDNARCANVFICLEDGAVEFHEWEEEELSKQWANFADLLRIWLRNAGYTPGSPLGA